MAGIGDIQREANLADPENKVTYEQVRASLEGIKALILKGEKITLQDFGTFTVKEKPARKARNPKTGEQIDVPAKIWPHFRFNNTFRDKVNTALNAPKKKSKKK